MRDWAAWQPCSVTCGNGTTSRKRNITAHPVPRRLSSVNKAWKAGVSEVYGGTACGDTSETEACNSGVACASARFAE